MSVLAHIQRSPPPPLLSCLCRERLFWFYSEAFDLVLSVCWQPFNTVLQVQAFTNQAQVGQGKGREWGWHKCMELVKGLFGKLHHPFHFKTVFHGPFRSSLCYPHNPQPFAWCTCKCCLCQTEALGAFLEGWWIHYLFTQTWFRHKQL